MISYPLPPSRPWYKQRKLILLLGFFGLIALGMVINHRLSSNQSTISPQAPETNQTVKKLENQLPQLQTKATDNPDDYSSQKEYAEALYITQRNDAAIKSYEKVVRLNPKDAESYTRLGNIYRSLADYTQAEQAYTQSLKIQPNQINAYVNLAHLYIYNMNKKNDGLKILVDLTKKFPEKDSLRMMLGKTYEQLGDRQSAQKIYSTSKSSPQVIGITDENQ